MNSNYEIFLKGNAKIKMNSKITIFFLILANIFISSILILIPKDHVELILVGAGGIIAAVIGGVVVISGIVLIKLSNFFLNFFLAYFFLNLTVKIIFKFKFLQRDDLPNRFIVLDSIFVSLIYQNSIFQDFSYLIYLFEKIQYLIQWSLVGSTQ